MRCFLAIGLGAEVKKNITDFVKNLPQCRGVKLVPQENLHITLDFLGEIGPKDCASLEASMKVIAGHTHPFRLSMGGVGAFPNKNAPHVLWLGMEREPVLMNLAKQVKAAAKSGDKKPFSPHLTIGRVKFEDRDFHAFLEQFFADSDIDFGAMEITSFYLMKSDLSKVTPIYTVLKRFTFPESTI